MSDCTTGTYLPFKTYKRVGGDGAVENPPLQTSTTFPQRRFVEGHSLWGLAPLAWQSTPWGHIGHLGAGRVVGPVQVQLSLATGSLQESAQLRWCWTPLEVREHVHGVRPNLSSTSGEGSFLCPRAPGSSGFSERMPSGSESHSEWALPPPVASAV